MSQHERSPFISVIVCAFNEEKLIQSCLSGLTTQTYPFDRYEVLVIDDESTDRTFEIVSDFINGLADNAPYIRITSIQHGGLSIARNSGIRLSKGEIIAFIDGDAVPASTWLEELIKPFLRGADYVGGRINLLNTDSWVAKFLQHTRHRQFFGPLIFNDQCIGCNMAFRKEIFDLVGGFQENFVARGDESTLQERISKRFQYAPASDAIVLHERPNTVTRIILVTWKSATLSHLCAKASGRRLNWKETLLVVEQFLITIFLFLLCIIWFIPSLFLIPLFITALAVIRRFYLRPLNYAIAKGLIQEYGFIRGTVGHILFCFLLNVLEFLGRIASPWLHRTENIVPPMISKFSVLKSVEITSKASLKNIEHNSI